MNDAFYELNEQGHVKNVHFCTPQEAEDLGYVEGWSDDQTFYLPRYQADVGWVESGNIEDIIIPLSQADKGYLKDEPQESAEEGIIEKLGNDNKVLSLKVEGLKKQIEADKQANEEMTLGILDLMMGLL